MIHDTVFYLSTMSTVTTMSYPAQFSFADYWEQAFGIASICLPVVLCFAIFAVLKRCIKMAGK